MRTRRSVVKTVQKLAADATQETFTRRYTMISKLIHAVVLVACFIAPNRVGAGTVVNFDSLPASGLPEGLFGPSLTNYLATFGITLSNVTPGTAVAVFDTRELFGGDRVIPTSPFNIIGQEGSVDAISYTLNFAIPQEFFSLSRTAIHPGSTGNAYPEWSASAYDASGNLLRTVGENAFSIFTDLPAETFTLDGPGITSVRIASDAQEFAAFGSVLLDDFTISSVPEPTSIVSLGLGLAGFAACIGCRRLRRCRTT